MHKNLHLERWLLLLKKEAVAAGLEARVRALDRKGGRWLALAVRQSPHPQPLSQRARGDNALEIRYYKRLVGPAMVAAATGPEIVGRVREAHERLLKYHRRVLENGLRRFLRRSIGLLQALETALLQDRELLKNADAALRRVPDAPVNLRPAAAARKKRGLGQGFEILPAAGLPFFGIRDGLLVDLSLLAPLSKKQSAQHAQHQPWGDWVGEAGVELVEAGIGAVDPGAAAADTAASAAAGLADVAQVAGSAVDVVAQGGSACADASAGGIDCGGFDCVPG
ncbi:MAG: hypothetical protein L0215_09060 [Gemmataceae bacterium]|nr:hypothetical protein [Gemmataceae bacterium]